MLAGSDNALSVTMRKVQYADCREVMNGFNAIFENDDRDNRLFDTKRPLHYAEGACFVLIQRKDSNAAFGEGYGVMWNANCSIN